MEITNRDLPAGSELRSTPENERLDTMEANAVEASNVSSVARASESRKVLILPKTLDLFYFQ